MCKVTWYRQTIQLDMQDDIEQIWGKMQCDKNAEGAVEMRSEIFGSMETVMGAPWKIWSTLERGRIETEDGGIAVYQDFAIVEDGEKTEKIARWIWIELQVLVAKDFGKDPKDVDPWCVAS